MSEDRNRREHAATAVVGAGLVGGSAMLREGALSDAHRQLGLNPRDPKQRKTFPVRTLVKAPKSRARRNARLAYAGGAAGGLAGMAGMGLGGYNLAQTYRRPKEEAAKALTYNQARDLEDYGNTAAVLGTTGAGLSGLWPAETPKGKARLRRAAIAGLAVGASGAAASLHGRRAQRRMETPSGMVQERYREVGKADDKQKGFLRTGLSGTYGATRERIEHLKKPKSPEEYAIPLAVGGAAGTAGSFAGHAALNRTRFKNTRLRPAVTALTGATATIGSFPATQAAMRRRGYDASITGGSERRKPPGAQRPTTKARVVEARPGRSDGRHRDELVPSDRFRKDDSQLARRYPGYGMSRGKKQATVMAAGSFPVPFVNDAVAAGTAARLMPPEHRKRVAAEQFGYTQAGSIGGAVAGGAATGELARRSKTVNRGAQRIGRMQRRATANVIGGIRGKEKGLAYARRAARGPKLVPGRYRRVAGAVGVGAMGGQMAGGQTAGIMALNSAMNREDARNRRIGNVRKAAAVAPLTPREQVEQRRRRERAVVANVIGGSAGLSALGSWGMKAVQRSPKARGRWGAVQNAGLVIGGGAGGYNALNAAALERRKLKAERAPVAKAWRPVVAPPGVRRAKTLRAPTVRRGGGGKLVLVRSTWG